MILLIVKTIDMKSTTFLVKHENMFEFVRQYFAGMEALSEEVHNNHHFNPHSEMKDSIIIKKGAFSEDIEEIVFHLKDVGRLTNDTIDKIYGYSVAEHDSVSYKLIKQTT
ncbi:MAG: hypothetical protein COB15_09575 [Flavobacteriales bacterium]|nr:MAG: hypothetical protein COB15_09575 [Flavobacteriales bacterium]